VFQYAEPPKLEIHETIEPAAPPPLTLRDRLGISTALLCALLLFAAGWAAAWRYFTRPAPVSDQNPVDPTIHELWAPWLNNQSGTSICFSNRMMAIVKFYAKPVSLGTVPGRMRASPAEDANLRRAFSLPATGYIYLTPSAEQTKMGEAMSGVYLANLLASARTSFHTTDPVLLIGRRSGLKILLSSATARTTNGLIRYSPNIRFTCSALRETGCARS
jgi:hypothetical protein